MAERTDARPGVVTELGYLGMEVRDLGAWTDFGRFLGAEVAEGPDGDSLTLRIDERPFRCLVQAGTADDVSLLGWQVATEEDLALVADRLVAAGFPVEHGSTELADRRRVARLICTRDAEGVPNEVFVGPFVPDEPFAPSRPMTGGFRTGELGMGHVAVTVGDAAAALAFYRDGLGLALTDYTDASTMLDDGGWIYFLRANPRHHSIVFGQATIRPRMHHWLMEVDELDDVGRIVDLAEEAGVPIMQTLGKHNNDHMVSVYLATPSGFEVEYGWGGRSITDPDHTPVQRSHGDIWGHHRTDGTGA